MVKKQFGKLEVGDKISFYGDKFIIEKIDFSEKGIKQGKSKCRIEAKNLKTGEQKVIIKLVEELAEVE